MAGYQVLFTKYEYQLFDEGKRIIPQGIKEGFNWNLKPSHLTRNKSLVLCIDKFKTAPKNQRANQRTKKPKKKNTIIDDTHHKSRPDNLYYTGRQQLAGCSMIFNSLLHVRFSQ
ncbi:unnamed protein product [Ambrosiozyma monospora]|uniref:Unnamed protein product n=1 Tax=Ambrosiozyma monospora TaxID=43982 RepID=A0ACB5T1F6_AMBMO|nr:unnamed protein product [Ambrosiozyma monospora]